MIDLIASAAFGGATKSVRAYIVKKEKSEVDVTLTFKIVLYILFNTLVATSMGAYGGYLIQHLYDVGDLIYIITAGLAAVSINLSLAFLDLNWLEVLDRRLGGKK